MSLAPPAPLRLPSVVQQHRFTAAAQTAQALAIAVARNLKDGVQRRGRAGLIVAGGRTPIAFLDRLARQPLAWSDVSVSLTDERCVPADHPDRNEALVRRHLLQDSAASARFVPLLGPGADCEQLQLAQQALASLPWPSDVVVLGMGEDGHVASLFAGAEGSAPALDARSAERVALVAPSTAPHRRISLTLPALLDTRAVMILIQGERKRIAIERAAGADPLVHPIGAFLGQQSVPVHLYYSP